MELKQLEYFMKVAEHESFTRAADELYITQPAISRSIRLLEEELGHELFLRKNQKIMLTEYGRTFLYYARQCFSALANGKRALDNLESQERNTITISATQPDLFMELLEAYLNSHPEVRILQPASNRSLEHLLLNRDIDFCISTPILHNPNLEWRSLLREPILLLLREAHPLAARKQVRLSDLKEEPLVMPVPGSPFRELVDAYFSRTGFAPKISYEVNELAMIRKMVELGLGVALFPATAYLRVWRGRPDAPPPRQNSLTAVPFCAPLCEREVGAYLLRDAPLSDAAHAFYEFTTQFFADLGADARRLLIRNGAF